MVSMRPAWFAVVLGLLFLVPAAPPSGPSTPEAPEVRLADTIVRIHVAPSEVAALGPGLEVVETYDTFVIARASTEAVARLAEKRVTVVPEDTFTLHVNGYAFDTRGEVRVPTALAAPEQAGTAYYIVQFVGPVKEECLRRLESLGPRIVGYVPNNAFVVRATADEVAKAYDELREVQWTGAYHPAFRIAPDLLEATGTVTVKIITFGEERVGAVVSTLAKMGMGVVGRFSAEPGILAWGPYSDFGLVLARVDASLLVPLARLSAARHIETKEEMQLFNQQEQYVLQMNASTDPGTRRIWDMGLRGELQTIALADTGLDYDHTMFRHSQSVVTTGDIYNTTVSTRRKVVRYLTMSQYVGVDPWGSDSGPRKDSPDGFCGSGHGTFTSGSAAGDDTGMTPSSANDGMAPNAKLIMLDIGRVDATACDDSLSYIPDDYADMFGPAYAAPNNVRIFSNSWGGTSSAYTTEARMVDTFVWNYPDTLILFANGNNPPNPTVGSPATNKNGAAISGANSVTTREAMGAASRGPTTDLRRKPDITTIYQTTAPGGSAVSDGDPGSFNSGDSWFGGTSYSTPLAAGIAALARRWFHQWL